MYKIKIYNSCESVILQRRLKVNLSNNCQLIYLFFVIFYLLRRKDTKSKEESRRKDEMDRKGSKDSKVQQLETKCC